jgi:subtilase family serine protease
MRWSARVSQLSIRFSLCLGVLTLMVGSAFAQGTMMGPEDVTKQISVTVWLNLHNKPALDALVQGMYDKDSPDYHHFLTMDQFKAQFSPSAKEAATVSDYLAAHNLIVTSVDKFNLFVTARGTVADAQAAFNVQINRMMLGGAMHRVNTPEASVAGPANALISAVQGLSDLSYRVHVSAAINPETGTAYAGVPLSAAGPDGLFFSAECLRPPQFQTFTTAGGFPLATYFGNRYGADITSGPPNLPALWL